MKAPLRKIVARVGRHALRLECGHVEVLAVGEADSVGKRMPCDRCAASRSDAEGGAGADAEGPR